MHSAIQEHTVHKAYTGGPELGRPTPGGHPQGLQMTTCMQGYN